MLRVLSFTSLFPNPAQPRHGIFIRTRLAEVAKTGAVDLRVIAPVPWFPCGHRVFGRYSIFARVPAEETLDLGAVSHPAYVTLPRLGTLTNPVSMALAAFLVARRLVRRGWSPDLIDAHYFYPDGVAAALLAKWLAKPLMITARGSDINYWPTQGAPRHQIRWAASKASICAAVSSSLAAAMVDIGIPEERIVVLRNGVDLALFHPGQRDACRTKLGFVGSVILSVGNFVPVKAHHLAIEALSQIPGASLILIGSGPEEYALRALCNRLGLQHRVRFVGVLTQQALREYYVAADALILASEMEGWPNVLLESMACGTPVVSSAVGAAPEIVSSEVGRLLFSRAPAALADAASELLAARIPRGQVRAHAEKFGWDDVSRDQLKCFQQVAREFSA